VNRYDARVQKAAGAAMKRRELLLETPAVIDFLGAAGVD
jgi:hypothetical protein